jgi:light-regulated signal transduction histidine kinase (bacteriophytochrome)
VGDSFKQPLKNLCTLEESPVQKLTDFTNRKSNSKPVEKYIKFEIRIADSGPGISPENLSRLFMNFGKLEEHAESNQRGTGLGLSICKSLIELMSGSVRVESELGIGSTFIMSLQTKCMVPGPKKVTQWLKKRQLPIDLGLI